MLYTTAISRSFTGAIDYDTDTFKAMLLTSGYTPSKNHVFRSDLGANESSGAGYTAGGITLATPTVTINTTTHEVTVGFGSTVTFPTVTVTARYLAIYKSRGGAATADELVGVVDLGSSLSSTAANFQVTLTQQFVTTNNSV
jgi:hypothetical protein